MAEDAEMAGMQQLAGLDADRFVVHIEGAAVVTAAGRADEQRVALNGVARYDARGLESRVVQVDVAKGKKKPARRKKPA